MSKKTLQREAPVKGEPERKSYPSVIKSIDQATRRIDFIISTESVDRYGDVIRVKGWSLKPYKANPVVLFGHQNREPPVAQAVRVWKEDGALRATAQFMSEDLSPFAHSIFRMYEERFLRATSVGFMPREWDFIQDADGNITGYDFVKSELLEFSAVPVPANPEALVNARAKGINTAPFKKWAEHMLDEWPERESQLRGLYGIDRKGLESIRRKAAGTGAVYRLSAEETEELRRRNFGDIIINIGGADAVEKDAQRSFANSGMSEDQDHKESTMKVKQGIFGVSAAEVEELKEACKEAELYAIPLPDKDGKKQFLLVPEIDSGMMEGTKGIQMSVEEHNGKRSFVIDKAPKLAVIAPEVLGKDANLFEFKMDDKASHVLLTIKGANFAATYKLHGMVDADAELMAELVGTKDQKQPNEKGDDADKGTKKPDTKDTKKESKDGEESKDESKDESKGGDDAEGEKKATKDGDDEPLEIGGKKIPAEAAKEIRRLIAAAVKKEEDEAAKGPIDLMKEIEKAEALMSSLEEALAKAKKSGQFVSKLAGRKLKTLGAYLRELADDLDPEGKVKVNTNGHDESKSDDKDEIDLKDLGSFLAKEVQPQLAALIATEVKKARGALD